MVIKEISIHTEKEWRGFSTHKHPDIWQLDYFGKGEGRYFLNDYWLRIDKNTVFIIPPNYYHQVEMKGREKIENLSIKFVFESNEEEFILTDKPEKIKIKNGKMIDKLFKKVLSYYLIGKNKNAEKYLKILILELIKILKNNQSFSLDSKINLVKEIIEENYSLNKITLSFISQKANLSRYHLCRKFKMITGKNLFSYLKEIRMNKSYHLILDTDEPIKKIAHLCGFKNVFYFTTIFKNYFKITPAKLRKERDLKKSQN